MVYVQCEICLEIMSTEEANAHKELTGHNSWTLLEKVEEPNAQEG